MYEPLRFAARRLEGEQMAPLCREFGISRVTGHKLFKRFKTCGLEPFEQMGLWKQLQAVPHVELRAGEFYLNGRLRARAEFDPATFGTDFAPRWMSQPALLEMLVAEGQQIGRAHV